VAKKGKALIVIRLLDAKFPDYQNVIPKRGEDKENIITINRKPLLEAMRRMMIIRTDQYQGVKMNIGINYLEMVSVNPDLGNAEEKVEVKYEGEPIEMGFNPRYFIDALQPMDSDIVYLDIKDQTSPCLITGDQDDGFLGLIMPMRV
jgi:DNA polymerase-3 subunit beta